MQKCFAWLPAGGIPYCRPAAGKLETGGPAALLVTTCW